MNQKESILIVDDDKSTSRSLQLIFGKKGYETEIAGTAQEALERIKKSSFNVALIDIRLPDMEGTVLLGKLKKAHPEMACMVITGYASLETAIMTIKLGSNGYFVKPLVMEEVIYRIEETLDKQRMERKLKESEQKYRTLYESSKDGIAFSDMEGNLLDANQAFLDMLGYRIEEIRRLSYYDLTPKKWHKITKDIIKDQTMVRGYSKEYEKEYIKKDGTLLPITVRSWLVKDNQQKPVGTWAIIRDITEQKQAEERLKKTMDATIKTVSKIIEAKDPYTAGHQQRVSQLATAIAKELNLSQDKVEGIRLASLIHDIGKISIPSEILSKPTSLTEIEFNLIKDHSQTGYDILKSIDFTYPIAQIILQHHERINGSGYPQGLKGEDILLEAKIIGIVDVVEAMSSHRPYRPALGIDKALEEISQNKGILYDPEVVDTCLKLFKEKRFKL